MDYILLALCSWCGLRGFFKGLLTMAFSMVGIIFVGIVAWQVKDYFAVILNKIGGDIVFNFLKNKIDLSVAGTFSDISQLKDAVANSNFNIFGIFLFKLLTDLTVDGEMTAGQILAPSITNLLIKILAFVLVFVVLYLFLKILKLVLSKIIKKCGLSFADRILGLLFGLIKGSLLFGVLYLVLTSFANLTLNEGLLNFVQKGVVSSYVYNHFISKIIAFFY